MEMYIEFNGQVFKNKMRLAGQVIDERTKKY